VDVASKPTLASYNIRPDAFDPRRPGPPNKLQTSKGRDEALLAILDRHSEVADAKIKSRDYKGAITLLRRTYALVNAHSSPAPEDGRALVVRVATACLRLQLCAALSRIGRHAPALDEASAAKLEMEEIWESLTGAAVEMAMAEAGGDTTKPHPVLRSHICNPPCWLERAIACSVQSRLCMAVEMEYLLLAAGLGQGKVEDMADMLCSELNASQREEPSSALLPPIDGERFQQMSSEDADELLWQGQVGMPTSPMTPAEQIEQLYREAIDLAARLLPASHTLVRDAEKAAATALERQRLRQQESVEEPAEVEHAEAPQAPPESPKAPQPEVPPAPASPAAVRRVSLPDEVDNQSEETLPLPPRDLMTRTKRGVRPGLRASNTMPSLQSALDESEMSESFPTEEEKVILARRHTDSESHGDWVRRSPPGDVFYRSLPNSFQEATGESRSSWRPRRRKKKANQQEGLQQSTDSHDGDPFKEWAKEFMHVENMTLFQRKLLTLEGMRSLHTDMKIETKRFRQVMHDLELYGGEEQERLGNNRILYTDAGMKAFRAGQARNEAVRKAAWKATPWAQKFAEREKDLFAYYGMSKQYEKGVDVKSLRKILEESFERTPEQKAKRKKEEDERRRQEQEEAEAKKRELSQIGFRKSRSRTQKLNKDRMAATR